MVKRILPSIVNQALVSSTTTDSIELTSVTPSPGTTLHRGTSMPFEVTVIERRWVQ